MRYLSFKIIIVEDFPNYKEKLFKLVEPDGNDSLKMVTVKIPEDFVDGLNRLVGDGMYPSRSAAIRVAVRDLLKEILWMANENTALMDTPITFKRWILVTCPECRKIVNIRKDWKRRQCPHCKRKFSVNFDKLLIIGTCEKLADTQRYMSRSNNMSPRINRRGNTSDRLRNYKK